MEAQPFLLQNYFNEKSRVIDLNSMINQVISNVSPISYSSRYIGLDNDRFSNNIIRITDEESARIIKSITDDGYAETDCHLELSVVKSICNITSYYMALPVTHSNAELVSTKGQGSYL